MKKFIFDVDGTLTPSRKQMDVGFSAEFLIFCCKRSEEHTSELQSQD